MDVKRKGGKIRVGRFLGILFFLLGFLTACGGNNGNGGGTFTLSATGQFPVQSNASFSTTGQVAQCSFLCEATLTSGGLLLLSASLDATAECFDGEPLGGGIQFFDRAEVSVPSFDQGFNLEFSCTNLAEDLLLGVVGGFAGNSSFRARSGEEVDLGALSLFRQDIVNIDFCFGNRIETLVLAEFLLACTREGEDFTGLGGLCSISIEEQVAGLNEFFGCPYCGDGAVNDGEACERDEDCPDGKFCESCQCVLGECGDGLINAGEECDFNSGLVDGGCPEGFLCDKGSCSCFVKDLCTPGLEICDDGCDNDLDGDVDCLDVKGCCSSIHCESHPACGGGGGLCGNGLIDPGENCDESAGFVNGCGDPEEVCNSCLFCEHIGACFIQFPTPSEEVRCLDHCDGDNDNKIDCNDEDCCLQKDCIGLGVCDGPRTIPSF